MEHTHPATRDNDQSAKPARRYSPDETQDYAFDEDDVPAQRRRFCFTHGYDESCGAADCEVIEEAA